MKEEAKMVYLLECLQKTPPPVSMLGTMWSHWGMAGPCAEWAMLCTPLSKREWTSPGAVLVSAVPACRRGSDVMPVLLQVLIFAEKKADVDAIHEYLLLKGVEAVAIHGGKGQ